MSLIVNEALRYDAVILYGPPGSGKDTVTDTLVDMDSRFLLHRRIKIGAESSGRYRATSLEELNELERAGEVLFRNERYGNVYAFARKHLEEDLRKGIPVVHVGQVVGVRALKGYLIRWLSVALWCSRETTAERMEQRGSTDERLRLAAWDETQEDLQKATDDDFDLRLNTDLLNQHDAARAILDLV